MELDEFVQGINKMAQGGFITTRSAKNLLLYLSGVPSDSPLLEQEPGTTKQPAGPGRPTSDETDLIRSLQVGERCAIYVGERKMNGVRVYIYQRAKEAGLTVSTRYSGDDNSFIVTRTE